MLCRTLSHFVHAHAVEQASERGQVDCAGRAAPSGKFAAVWQQPAGNKVINSDSMKSSFARSRGTGSAIGASCLRMYGCHTRRPAPASGLPLHHARDACSCRRCWHKTGPPWPAAHLMGASRHGSAAGRRLAAGHAHAASRGQAVCHVRIAVAAALQKARNCNTSHDARRTSTHSST